MVSKIDPAEVYDLLILVDSTYGMDDYHTSLQLSLLRIIPISALTDSFSRIGILAYKDYCDKDLLKWSGWLTPSATSDEPAVDLIQMVKSLESYGGGDDPDATKTGLARAYELMRENATTLILLYTNGPPHTFANGDVDDWCQCLGRELSALKRDNAFGGFGPLFHDWVSAAKTLSGRTGKKKAQVFSFLDPGATPSDVSRYYLYLCAMTDGACFFLENTKPANISKATMEVLLAWMGAEKGKVSEYTTLPASLAMYNSVKGITELTDESTTTAGKFFSTPTKNEPSQKLSNSNLCSIWSYSTSLTRSVMKRPQREVGVTAYKVSLDGLKKHLPKKTTAVKSLAERYAADYQYKVLAVDNFRQIILDDVATISYNPVFGSLWRAVCNDYENKARDELIQLFGSAISRISDEGEKARMKAWLQESYDYTAELIDILNPVHMEQRFPFTCIDPTFVFIAATTNNDDNDDDTTNNDREITSFRRNELLEIGRSCEYKVPWKLGRFFTRLAYVSCEDEVPTHVARATEKNTPKTPLALATVEHKRQFWRILLHLLISRTNPSARLAALLAALSIRVGIKPLMEAATAELVLCRDRWNDPEVPEIWSLRSLSLLLETDKAYVAQQGTGDNSEHASRNTQSLLLPHDRELFERLVTYKILELNMQTTLTARLGWTPAKTTVPLGPSVVCKSCELPRSITIMGETGKCGLCLSFEWDSEEERLDRQQRNVTKDDNETTPVAWVECGVRTCRAQYVVYNPQSLNIRPKCYYCRNSLEAPVVECSECLSRMIWPAEYRPDNLTDYTCHLCKSGHKTIVEVKTTASTLSQENDNSWLIRNEGKLEAPFNNRSIYHTISTCGVQDFCEKVELFPESRETLTLSGKLVRNLPDVVQQLKSWVSGRRIELGTCSLCFTSKRKTDLILVCGRRGCHQRVCRGCLEGWYGLNARGRIINTAALFCAFCRRAPTAQTLARYGTGIHAVENLQAAIDERETWIYGWCQRCGLAKRHMDRVCAAGAPPEEGDWLCDHCHELVVEWESKPTLDVKECPVCDTMIERRGGCNHITCQCGTDWCFLCGVAFDNEDVLLDHMEEDHGGYYGDGRDWQSQDSYSDDDSDE